MDGVERKSDRVDNWVWMSDWRDDNVMIWLWKMEERGGGVYGQFYVDVAPLLAVVVARGFCADDYL